MIITVHGTKIELTESLKQYAEEKILGLSKFFPHITKAQIDLGLISNHHQKGDIYYAEVNVHLPRKIIRVVKEEADLYKAIDKVKDHLKVDLEKVKEKMRAKDKKTIRKTKEYGG